MKKSLSSLFVKGIKFLREHSAVSAALILIAGFVLAFLGAAKAGVKHYSYTDFKSGYMETGCFRDLYLRSVHESGRRDQPFYRGIRD